MQTASLQTTQRPATVSRAGPLPPLARPRSRSSGLRLLDAIPPATESLRANQGRSLLTILGIVIGVAAVITIVALGQSVQAGSAYQRALDRQPGYLPAVRGLAKLAVRDNRAPEAIRLLQEAADANPRSTAPLLELAAIHQQAGDRAAAIAAYRRALERNADDVVASNNLAVLLGGEATTLEEGLRLAERAHRQAPQSIAVADTLGWAWVEAGQVEKGLRYLREAQVRSPENPEIRDHLAEALRRKQAGSK